jgi:hypothetical protein
VAFFLDELGLVFGFGFIFLGLFGCCWLEVEVVVVYYACL